MAINTYVNDTGKPWKFTFTYSDGSPRPNIAGFTNANFGLRLQVGANPAITCTGNWTVLDAVNAIASYAPTAADVASNGVGTTQTTLALPGGPVTFNTDSINIQSKL